MSEAYFTYYGDLVGIKALYKRGSSSAYNKLSDYYNMVFHGLSAYHTANTDKRKITMFSDSLLVTGDDPAAFIQTLAPVYNTLVGKELLLRGGMVKGQLTKDARLETNNFEKFLPESDVLARAASMETEVKGARFLIDRELAEIVIQPKQDWITEAGYDADPERGNSDFCMQRSIVTIPDSNHFEILYPMLDFLEPEIFEARFKQLNTIKSTVSKNVKPQYTETIKVYEQSKARLEHQNPISHV